MVSRIVFQGTFDSWPETEWLNPVDGFCGWESQEPDGNGQKSCCYIDQASQYKECCRGKIERLGNRHEVEGRHNKSYDAEMTNKTNWETS